jgi:cyclase
MSRWSFTKGLHGVGNGVYAYLQPDGGLCLSNAGLLVEGDRSILVDTLMDLPLTREMLAAMSRVSPAAQNIDVLVNTHANLDHTFGNQLVAGAEIIASAACAEEMAEENQVFLDALRNPKGEPSALMRQVMANFDFDDIVITPPTRTFSDHKLTLPLGDRTIEVIHVGPAHTRGDVLVYSPADRVVFTGDVLFIDIHPVIWAGPWSSWIRACEVILELDVDVVVPGHGPITDKAGVKRMLDWIVYLRNEAKARYDAGLGVEETVRDIRILAPVDRWIEADRIVNNVNLLFREFGGRGVLSGPAAVTRVQERLGLGFFAPSAHGAHHDCDHA